MSYQQSTRIVLIDEEAAQLLVVWVWVCRGLALKLGTAVL